MILTVEGFPFRLELEPKDVGFVLPSVLLLFFYHSVKFLLQYLPARQDVKPFSNCLHTLVNVFVIVLSHLYDTPNPLPSSLNRSFDIISTLN